MDVNYTWSKELDNTDTMEDNQGRTPAGRQVRWTSGTTRTTSACGFSD